MSTFSAKQKAVAILPKPFSLLSIIGSSYIVYHVLKNPKRRRAVQYQILLGLSLADIMASISFFVGTWPIPAYVNDEQPTVYLASGTDPLCDAHGFFVQATIMTPVYNAALSLYYVMVVKMGWNESKIKKLRWWFHVFPLAIGLGTAIAGQVLQLYGNATLWCWISPSSGNEQWNLYRWAFYYGILWFMALVIIIPSMIVIFVHVRKQEAAAAKWRHGQSQAQQYANSRKVAMQGISFSASFIATWIFPTLTRLMQAINGVTYYPLVVLFAIFLPLQGFFNAGCFLRPKYLKYRKDNPHASIVMLVRTCVFSGDGKLGSVLVTMFPSTKSNAEHMNMNSRRSSNQNGEEEDVAETNEQDIEHNMDEDGPERHKSIKWADGDKVKEEMKEAVPEH